MTTHDDSDLQVLERDLWLLAEPRDGDEQLRLTVRRQLAAAARPQPRRSPRRAPRWVAATAAMATIALAALVATAGSGGPGSADAAIIHRALTALTPPANAILHVKVVGVQNGVAVAGETWQQTTAPFASRGRKGGGGDIGEFADNGTTSFAYDPSTNTIYERPDSSHPTFTDPIAQIRRQLARGQGNVTGAVTIGGVSLYRIDLPYGMVGYFDTATYLPRYIDDPQRDGTVLRLRVGPYEYLPMTPANRATLSLTTQHPTARIDANPRDWPGK